MNKVFKNVLASRPSGGDDQKGSSSKPSDKGKTLQEEVTPVRVEPITVVVPSLVRPPVVPPSAPSKPHDKKKKSKRAFDRLSSQ